MIFHHEGQIRLGQLDGLVIYLNDESIGRDIVDWELAQSITLDSCSRSSLLVQLSLAVVILSTEK